MPEIGEIARLVYYIRKYLVGRTIASVQAVDDTIIFGKAGTTGTQFKEAVEGKKVLDVGQQGKYFWLVLSSPPHPLLHCSMTGWIEFKHDPSAFYKESKREDGVWPPKFWKFVMTTAESPDCQAAYTDPRRLGRVRLIDCPADQIRQIPPLSDNGPDPVIDKDIVREKWLVQKIRSRRVPIKTFLLDQANISGIGNWVADEILFEARIHPERCTDSLEDPELSRLHQALINVCTIAVETLADHDQFPEEWLKRCRMKKGDQPQTLSTGEEIKFLTVGGRTSAIVPAYQKKTGLVYQDHPPTREEDVGASEEAEAKRAMSDGKKRKGAERFTQETADQEEEANVSGAGGRKRGKAKEEKKATTTPTVGETPFQQKKAKRQPPRKAKAIRQGKTPPD